MQIEPATHCLLRAARSVFVFLELLQGRGERREAGEEAEEGLASLKKTLLCFPLFVAFETSSAPDCLLQMSRVAVSVRLELSQPNR